MVSLHLFSPDGVRWRASPTPPYTNRIPWADGSTSLVATRERPKLLLGRDGWPTHLISAVPEIGPTACGEKVRSPTAYLAGKRVDITMASVLLQAPVNCKDDAHDFTLVQPLDSRTPP